MTTDKFKKIILPILERILDSYRTSGDEGLKETLTTKFAEYEQMPLPLECHNILKALNKRKKKIDRKYHTVGIVKKAISPRGRYKFVATGAVLTLVLSGCVMSKANGATEKDNTQGEIETILEGNKQIDYGTTWAENFAANGKYDENAKESSNMFALATVLDSFANRDEYASDYVDALALGANYTSREEVQRDIGAFLEIHQQIVLGKGEVKYDQVLQKEKDAKLLNDLQSAWKNISATSSDQSKEIFDNLIEEFAMDVNQYSPFAVRLGTEFVTMGYDTPWKGGTVVTQNTIDTFYQNIQNYCTSLYATSTEKEKNQQTSNSTLQSVSDTLLYGYVDDLIKDKEHNHIKEDEKLYSYTEIRKGIADRIKDLKNSEVDMDAKADEVSMDNFKEKSIQKHGKVQSVSPNDKITTNEKGEKVINNGKTTIANSKGDEISSGAVDNTGKPSTPDKINHTFKEGYEDCINANGAESSKKYPNDSTYMNGWESAKADIIKLQEEQKKQETEDKNTEDILFPETNKPKDETTSTAPSTPDTSKPSAGETVGETTTTEDVYWNFGTDKNGKQYDINNFTDINTNSELGRSK